MDKEKQKEMKKNQELIDHYDYLKNAASSTDCTGLIPALPESEDELDAYNIIWLLIPLLPILQQNISA